MYKNLFQSSKSLASSLGNAAGRIATSVGSKAYQVAKKGSSSLYKSLSQNAPTIKSKLVQSSKAIAEKTKKVAQDFKNMIKTKQLLTIGKIIQSKKPAKYKKYLVKKYAQQLSKEHKVPQNIVQGIQKQLLAKIVQNESKIERVPQKPKVYKRILKRKNIQIKQEKKNLRRPKLNNISEELKKKKKKKISKKR